MCVKIGSKLLRESLSQIRTRIRVRICLSVVLKLHLLSLKHCSNSKLKLDCPTTMYFQSLQRRGRESWCLFISNPELTAGAAAPVGPPNSRVRGLFEFGSAQSASAFFLQIHRPQHLLGWYQEISNT